MLTVAAFIFAIGLLVAVHEWGHFAIARACGVRVLRFSVGFGPRLFGWTSRDSGTEYVVGVLPFGGYVKMLDEREGAVSSSLRPLAFNNKSVAQRSAIVAAGPAANLLFAICIYACLNWYGVEQPSAVLGQPVAGSIAQRADLRGGEKVLSVAVPGEDPVDIVSFEDFRWWLTRTALAKRDLEVRFTKEGSATQSVLLRLSQVDTQYTDSNLFQTIGILGPFSAPLLGDIAPNSAAQMAGLKSGDLVLSVDQKTITEAGQLRSLIRVSGREGQVKTQQWVVERQGAATRIAVTPKLVQEAGQYLGRIGAVVGAPPEMVTVRYGLFEGVSKSLQRTWEVSVLSLKMMGQILIGEASLKNLSGPITIADYAGKSAAMGVIQFAMFLALISISLGVLNLLPLPVLDGGHLMYYLWESLTGKPVTESWMDRLQRVGVAALVLMMSIAVYNDIARLIG